MCADNIKDKFRQRREEYLLGIEKPLEKYLVSILGSYPRIDRICIRSKSVERFVAKAGKLNEDGQLKYSDPLNQIQDQIGARIITFYLGDVEEISKLVKDYFRHVEELRFIPDSASEFGYEGRHFILFIPDDIITSTEMKNNLPPFFELQIKTMFQHAWSETSHDLGYKPSAPLSFEDKRRIAFTAAQAWGADKIFDELFKDGQSTRRTNQQNSARN